ncbi:nitroreductase family protein [Paenibacillus sp. MWE-103]|uniref:Nitroreductase family protein n=1 Tax=Paenibacillus artemisiicola TaxID=1172618 RepID=A0ABS3W464_9BACL|nr:nitroreductase family protein [Paenibacillus artemisiicola]MBO7743092.1 nitroreductase family protein [Paenibacillus artemisiicola]
MNVLKEIDFFTVIRERHAVRKYDPNVKISRQELSEMLSEAVLAPSTANVQPWRFLVISDRELKEKLLPVAFNQEQTATSAAMIVVLADLEAYKEVDKVYSQAVEAGYMTAEIKSTLVANLGKYYENLSPDDIKSSFLIDTSLAAMQFMLVAKAHGYDTVPMGGYDAQKLKEAFAIPDRYTDVMLIAVGKALEPAHQTVRLPVEDVAFWNGFGE